MGIDDAMATGRRASTSNAAPSPATTAAFIADLSTELAALARTERLELLAYFLEMAVLEARRVTEELDDREDAA